MVAFRWRSWLGLAVALFLVYGALSLLIAIFEPLALQFGGAGAFGFVPPVMSMDGDAALLGRPVEGLRQSDRDKQVERTVDEEERHREPEPAPPPKRRCQPPFFGAAQRTQGAL